MENHKKLIAIFDAVDKYIEDHPESVIEPDPEFEKEVTDLVDEVDIREDGEP